MKMTNVLIALFVMSNGLNVTNKYILKAIEEADEELLIEEMDKLGNNLFTLEDLIKRFEEEVSNKIEGGVVYTPRHIRDYIVSVSIVRDCKVGDNTCGVGAFLLTATTKLKEITHKSYKDIFRDNLYGLDISEVSIARTKAILSLLAIIQGEDEEVFEFPNIRVGNVLDKENRLPVDVIVGNPPYTRKRNLSKEDRGKISKWNFANVGNGDLYLACIEVSLSSLSNDGRLVYIVPNTFKTSVNGRVLREHFGEKYDISILDFGDTRLFSGINTYSAIIDISIRNNDNIKYQQITEEELIESRKWETIPKKLLEAKRGWILGAKTLLENIKKIETIGTPLHKMYKIKNGLATLANSIFTFAAKSEDDGFYFLDNNQKIEKGIVREVIKAGGLKKDKDIIDKKEYIIFPYKDLLRQSTRPGIISENFFRETYPNAYRYLEQYKDTLLQRDKGKCVGKYEWYQYGRSQSISDVGKKILFPTIANAPRFCYTDNESLLFYGGYALFVEEKDELPIWLLKRVLNSTVMWYYIKNTSKPYSGGYFSFSKSHVENFSIPIFKKEEIDMVSKLNDDEFNRFMIDKYGLVLDED